ncbi:phospholipid/cholesterol/gamma-HCH transport system ATP-binding protein [Oceanospirillum multiglobuliferum]|uniref:Phospholipid ABC transporter ATP-binding protein MlaF n=1 Tax=Oceanospirillum multiglobuliferum TaxID=64969 RepID=A0A1T4KTT5_9GAMM|nr:ATP-binding cassette domain-containing protein [Oceanospirillum multiglobuliferum]OPX54940.1 phospholipid ABC transporter ATP-binding protein MlaF [Oceanospirillum multiglobuliferum]SJZ45854.1 phospholipid/cholesterol/gamma-HCH transport system ATP-binding protein [Oceanospirillum multiglobuliferum]
MTSGNDSFVEITDLVFKREQRAIFSGLSLKIPRGKITAVMGPSGTGKTTLLRLIGGQLKPHSGSIVVDGIEVPSLARKPLFELRTRMGMLFQSGALFSELNVFENVAFPLRVHTALPEDMIRDLVLIKLESVGLRGARNLMPSELSGGMGRRVALARAIALDPELMMYDEPFVGQDPITLGVLVKLIRQLNDALNMTTVLVSHDIDESLSIADHVCVISGGKVVAEGSPEEIIRSEKLEVKQFIQGLPDGPVAFRFPADDFAKDIMTKL